MRRRTTDNQVRPGRRNVFADLEVAQPREVLAKAEIARQIADVISGRGLTQTEAAKLLGIDQPKISALLRGRLSGFSTERLLRFVTELGRDVEITLRPKPKTRARGEIRVRTKAAAKAR